MTAKEILVKVVSQFTMDQPEVGVMRVVHSAYYPTSHNELCVLIMELVQEKVLTVRFDNPDPNTLQLIANGFLSITPKRKNITSVHDA